MYSQQKITLGALVLYVLLVVLLTGCRINENDEVSPYVQDIVPAQQEPAVWYLSPVGDKLLYDTTLSQNQAIVRGLITGQEFTIADCARFRWLNNENVYCYGLLYDNNYEPFVATFDSLTNNASIQKSLIKEVTTAQVELEPLLKRAKAIYRLRPSAGPHPLLVFDTENANQYYYITEIEDLDNVLENYTYTTIPLSYRDAELSKKMYSPNRKNYYLLQDNLGIYDATSDQLLAEFEPPPRYESFFQIGGSFPNKSEGWAADNSGVYFQIRQSSGFGPPSPIQPIQKLCVPDIEGCTSAN